MAFAVIPLFQAFIIFFLPLPPCFSVERGYLAFLEEVTYWLPLFLCLLQIFLLCSLCKVATTCVSQDIVAPLYQFVCGNVFLLAAGFGFFSACLKNSKEEVIFRKQCFSKIDLQSLMLLSVNELDLGTYFHCD